MPKKIDLVYLWVDGNDRKWKKEKDRWLNKIKSEKEIYHDAAVAARWHDNDELRYSLRSAEKFVPWINHIFIITGFGHVPKWLDISNPKITIIPHEAIMPADSLPTFNSNAIEMCLMNIPNLSEYFLLANDDTFFGRPLPPDFFYDKKGRGIIWYTNNHKIKRNFGLWLEKLDGYGQTLALSAKLIRDIFGKNYKKLRPAHNIDPYIKSSIMQVRSHPMIVQQIDNQIRNKFRTNYELQRWIFSLYDHVHNKNVFRRARNFKKQKHFVYNFIHRKACENSPIYCLDAKESRLAEIIPPLFCINETEETTSQTKKNNLEFLKSYFPNKSAMEL
ncbi:MAG: Stealth CR1 domain-containing protein [Rickettsiales bacterium]|jgi:hypothetical protein|nr:Stealth CR1 domain-containing protein [Rickettsiales bacterium]